MLKNLSDRSLIRYLLVGGTCFVGELAMLSLLVYGFSLQRTLATALTFWIFFTLSFLLQKLLAFRDFNVLTKAIARQGLFYALLVGFNYAVTLVIVSVFPEKWLLVSRTIAIGLTTAWNYFIYKHFIFSEKPLRLPIKQWIKQGWRPLLFGLALMVPLVIYFWQYAFTGGKLMGGDFDYYAQMYEAFRISVLKFHELPLWNPWMVGGLPLFANPQFGLVSIQSLTTLLFGSIYGLKIAYLIYAAAGFWGMYTLGRLSLGASRIRSALISYIWVFCGFFAYHGLYHLTFALFFLIPWQIYFLHQRHRKWSWLGFAIVEAIIINSSVHYAFLMTAIAVSIFCVLLVSSASLKNKSLNLRFHPTKADLYFVLKAGALTLLLSGYRLLTTVYFVSGNERLITTPEINPTAGVLLQALFAPIDPFLPIPKGIQYGWGEYSMHLGVGTGLAVVFALLINVPRVLRFLKERRLPQKLATYRFQISIALLGVAGFLLALGNFSKFSPFNLLHHLPGFTQTRVPSRWLLLSAFAILVLLLAWRKYAKAVNVLLLAAVVELFLVFGPPRVTGRNQIQLPPAEFKATFQQYDSLRRHHDYMEVSEHSYYNATRQNIGLIYADDSLINTLNAVIGTSRCGKNLIPTCDFVLTKNARLISWSPNKIVIGRTAPGEIRLNINQERGWRVNNHYPFADQKSLDPTRTFYISDDNHKVYSLTYAPKLSPDWLGWKIQQLAP